MRKLVLFTLGVAFALIIGCSDNDNDLNNGINEQEVVLTQFEIDDLIFLREEEKLAHDVYVYSFNKYGNVIFKNISNSESKHMESVLNLLNKYKLSDPIINEIGKFNNNELQEIYYKLIAQTNISLLEALKVGNTIEDLDIKDILANELRTENNTILLVYQSLLCGSRNHLRNFNNQVISNNGDYKAQYITQAEFDVIVNEGNEQCGQANN